MPDLEEVIVNTASTLDYLKALREIVDAGDCNECAKNKKCKYMSKPGQLTRYNCPFFKWMKGEK